MDTRFPCWLRKASLRSASALRLACPRCAAGGSASVRQQDHAKSLRLLDPALPATQISEAHHSLLRKGRAGRGQVTDRL
jgi:hypothetical protein